VPGDLGLESALTASKSAGNLTLSWARTCLSTETDFEVYQGILGNFASHAPVLCSTGGATTATFVQPGGNGYFLVLAVSGSNEGSYGLTSTGAERTLSAAACLPQSIALCP
jgi:hypothetical protein